FYEILTPSQVDDDPRIGDMVSQHPFIVLQRSLIQVHWLGVLGCGKERILPSEHVHVSRQLLFGFLDLGLKRSNYFLVLLLISLLEILGEGCQLVRELRILVTNFLWNICTGILAPLGYRF